MIQFARTIGIPYWGRIALPASCYHQLYIAYVRIRDYFQCELNTLVCLSVLPIRDHSYSIANRNHKHINFTQRFSVIHANSAERLAKGSKLKRLMFPRIGPFWFCFTLCRILNYPNHNSLHDFPNNHIEKTRIKTTWY